MDYLTKLFKYRTSEVREYRIINPGKETVQIYSFEGKEDSEQYSFDVNISSGVFGDLAICISNLLWYNRPGILRAAGVFKQNNVFTRAAGGRALTRFRVLAEGGDYYEYIWGTELDREHRLTDNSNPEFYA